MGRRGPSRLLGGRSGFLDPDAGFLDPDAGAGAPDAGGATDAGAVSSDASQADAGQADAGPGTIDELITRCPGADVIAQIDADFEFVWEADVTAGTFVCTAADGSADLTRAQERVYQGFIAARALQFDEPLPWTDMPLYDWMAESIDGSPSSS